MSTNFLLFPLLFKFSNDMTFPALLWYSFGFYREPICASWSRVVSLAPGWAPAVQYKSLKPIGQNGFGWFWSSANCKVHCMPMLWWERHQKMRRAMAPASICLRKALPPAGAADGHLGPPLATCGFSPRLLRSPQTTFGYFGIRLWLT